MKENRLKVKELENQRLSRSRVTSTKRTVACRQTDHFIQENEREDIQRVGSTIMKAVDLPTIFDALIRSL